MSSTTDGIELTAMTAQALAAIVRRGELSPAEVIRAHLARIDLQEGTLNAFQVVRHAKSLAEAEEVGRRGDLAELPLAGVPVAIKDNVAVEGEPTRHGSAATADAPAAQDDELVRRLRQAGCVVIGKTRMPELAIWPFTESSFGGPTRNPWDTTRTPGGSSGGGAAAVSAGMASLALGSDGGGSIRIPSACCGIVGLKPGPGLVPVAGGADEHWLGLTQFGPMGRNVADVALMLDVLAGRPPSGEVRPPERALRIVVSTRHPTAGASVGKEVAVAVEAVAESLGAAGHQIVRDDPPYPANLGLRFGRRWLPGIADDARDLPVDRLESRTRSMARAGRWIRRRGWAQPAGADPLVKAMTGWLAGRDVLLTATIAEPAVTIGRWDGEGWIRTTLGAGNWVLTTPWNVAGFAAASVPAGLSGEGLPIGVQLVAPPQAESLLLSVMAQVEKLRPFPVLPIRG